MKPPAICGADGRRRVQALDALRGFDMIWIIGSDAYTIASVRRDVVSAPISRQWNTVTNRG